MSAKTKATIKTVKKSRDQLVEDFKRVVADLHDLGDESKNASGAAIKKGYNAVQDDIKNGVHAMKDVGCKIAAGAESWRDSISEEISSHPWRSLAIAVVASFAVNRLFSR
jgi:ElaB/YqjD/DUF883 family membrane-anchored ribosome-binding protein